MKKLKKVIIIIICNFIIQYTYFLITKSYKNVENIIR